MRVQLEDEAALGVIEEGSTDGEESLVSNESDNASTLSRQDEMAADSSSEAEGEAGWPSHLEHALS